jgi:hypothetical protein
MGVDWIIRLTCGRPINRFICVSPYFEKWIPKINDHFFIWLSERGPLWAMMKSTQPNTK